MTKRSDRLGRISSYAETADAAPPSLARQLGSWPLLESPDQGNAGAAAVGQNSARRLVAFNTRYGPPEANWVEGLSDRSRMKGSPMGHKGPREEFVVVDRPPLKWSALSYGFGSKEDRDAEENLQAGRDRREAAPG